MSAQPENPVATRDTATKLALQRTSAAYDRTLMAWIRTSISLITFGFGTYKFFQMELQRGVQSERHLIGPREFSLIMVAAGLLAMVLGIADHWLSMRGLRAQDPSLPGSRAFVFALIIFTLGLLALAAVIFRQ
jgi:putative membrane protein